MSGRSLTTGKPYSVSRSGIGYVCEGQLVVDRKVGGCLRAASWRVTDEALEMDHWYCEHHFRRLYPELWATAKKGKS